MGIENVAYNGQNFVSYRFRRGRRGLEINVRAIPEIEAFMRDLGPGTTDDVTLLGKEWYHPNPDEALKIYKMKDTLHTIDNDYRIDIPGYTLTNDAQVNLSFLRIAGVSSEGGITFGVKGAYSLPYVIELKSKIGRATRRFVKDYVAPIDLHLMIVEG